MISFATFLQNLHKHIVKTKNTKADKNKQSCIISLQLLLYSAIHLFNYSYFPTEPMMGTVDFTVCSFQCSVHTLCIICMLCVDFTGIQFNNTNENTIMNGCTQKKGRFGKPLIPHGRFAFVHVAIHFKLSFKRWVMHAHEQLKIEV